MEYGSCYQQRWRLPVEIIPGAVDPDDRASLVPESAADRHCAVAFRTHVVVAVVRAEHHCIVVPHLIAGVTRVPGYHQPVVVRLTKYNEWLVLGPVPGAIIFLHIATSLHVNFQLVAVVYRQLTDQVVAEPEVAIRIVKSDFILRPRTIEDVVAVDMLLD